MTSSLTSVVVVEAVAVAVKLSEVVVVVEIFVLTVLLLVVHVLEPLQKIMFSNGGKTITFFDDGFN